MNIKDIKGCLIVDIKNPRPFYVEELCRKGEPLFEEIKTFTPDFEWDKINQFLQNKFRKVNYDYLYHLNSIGATGDETNLLSLWKTIDDGLRFNVFYKKCSFHFCCMANGEIKRIDFMSPVVQSPLCLRESIEELYLQGIEYIKQDKRKMMTHFNKDIRDLKQDYKQRLKRYNDILKGE